MKDPILEVNNLRVSFRTYNGKVQAVRGIDFKLFEGETLAIVGESGSGKSVTTKAILGILPKNSIIEEGEILYKGDDLTKYKEKDFYKIRGKEISLIFQDPLSALNPIMKIGKQITEALVLREHMTKERLFSIPGTPPNMIFPPKGDAFAERNQYAMQVDFEEEPPFFKLSDTHYAATWLLHPNAPKVEMPEALQHRIARMNRKEGV